MRQIPAVLVFSTLVFSILLAGCQNMGSWGRDPVSGGSAKLLLKKGETRPDEVMQAFGGPNVVYGNADGYETWTYDRMSYVTSSSETGGILGGAGSGGSGGLAGLAWGRSSSSSASSRTVTLILKWKDDVLVDYEYRTSIY